MRIAKDKVANCTLEPTDSLLGPLLLADMGFKVNLIFTPIKETEHVEEG